MHQLRRRAQEHGKRRGAGTCKGGHAVHEGTAAGSMQGRENIGAAYTTHRCHVLEASIRGHACRSTSTLTSRNSFGRSTNGTRFHCGGHSLSCSLQLDLVSVVWSSRAPAWLWEVEGGGTAIGSRTTDEKRGQSHRRTPLPGAETSAHTDMSADSTLLGVRSALTVARSSCTTLWTSI